MTQKNTLISIYHDHITYRCEETTHYPQIEGVSIQVLASIVLRWHDKYRLYMKQNQPDMSLETYRDFEGLADANYIIRYGDLSVQEKSIRIHFSQCDDNDFDIKTDVKTYRNSERFIHLKCLFAIVQNSQDDVDVWIKHEAERLQNIMNSLDKATQNLHCWAQQGLDMNVYCHKCNSSSVISNINLHIHNNNGLSLDDLKNKLRCKKCASYNPTLRIAGVVK